MFVVAEQEQHLSYNKHNKAVEAVAALWLGLREDDDGSGSGMARRDFMQSATAVSAQRGKIRRPKDSPWSCFWIRWLELKRGWSRGGSYRHSRFVNEPFHRK